MVIPLAPPRDHQAIQTQTQTQPPKRPASNPHYPTASQATNATTFGSYSGPGSVWGSSGSWFVLSGSRVRLRVRVSWALFYGIDYHNYCNTFAWLDSLRLSIPTFPAGLLSFSDLHFFFSSLQLFSFHIYVRLARDGDGDRYGEMAEGNSGGKPTR